MQLREYIYIDERRVNSYAEQLHPGKVIDKAPEWTAEVSIAGVKASGTQKSVPRDMTIHEKIQLVENSLTAAKPPLLCQLDSTYYYPMFSGESTRFVRGEMVAQRLRLDGNVEEDTDARSIIVWGAAAPDQDPGLISNHSLWRGVCLVEDFPRDDRAPLSARLSTYSAFAGLLAAMSSEFLAANQHAHDLVETQSRSMGSLREDIMSLCSDPEICGIDPVSILEGVGAKRIGGPRQISTLFHIRQYSTWQTLGYPIYITA